VLYTTLLALHNVLRWVVLVAGIVAAVRVVRGAPSSRAGLVFIIALDTQALLGIVMYAAVSPWVKTALADVGASMKDHAFRFWLVEHPFAMFFGLVLAHVARVVERKDTEGKKRRRVAVLLTLAVALILAGIPWPFLPYGRPLLPRF
jgi:hypothetical protein